MYGMFNRVYRVVVLGLKEGLVECATVCVKSVVILEGVSIRYKSMK